jgi:hypothetical protein
MGLLDFFNINFFYSCEGHMITQQFYCCVIYEKTILMSEINRSILLI